MSAEKKRPCWTTLAMEYIVKNSVVGLSWIVGCRACDPLGEELPFFIKLGIPRLHISIDLKNAGASGWMCLTGLYTFCRNEEDLFSLFISLIFFILSSHTAVLDQNAPPFFSFPIGSCLSSFHSQFVPGIFYNLQNCSEPTKQQSKLRVRRLRRFFSSCIQAAIIARCMYAVVVYRKQKSRWWNKFTTLHPDWKIKVSWNFWSCRSIFIGVSK